MAIIKCTECGKEISDHATSCPSCGRPMNDKIITIQATKKKWKLIKLISWIGFIVGLMLFSNYINGGFQNPRVGAGLSLTFISFIGIVIGKFGSWWTNK